MVKVTNFELSKKINELWFFDWIETEWCYFKMNWNPYFLENYKWEKDEKINAFNLEELISILPNRVWDSFLVFWKNEHWYWGNYLMRDEDELYILDDALFPNISWYNELFSVVEIILEKLIDWEYLK